MRHLAAIMLAVFAFGCVRNRLPEAPVQAIDDSEFSVAEEAGPPGVDSDPAEPLKLLPGDVIQLTTVSATTRVYKGLIVDATNHVHVPLAGGVEAGGLPLGDAEKRIERAMRRYEPYVRVSVVITQPSGHSAAVLGAVQKAGRVMIHPGMRLADLFAAVGGPAMISSQASRENTVVAAMDLARLVREGETMPVSLPAAMRGDPRHNVRIRPGDILYVPPGTESVVLVIGDVRDPQPIAYRQGMRLSEALARVGGITPRGDRNDIRVVRGPLHTPKVFVASVKDLVNGNRPDVVLARGDIVYVTTRWVASTGEVLNAFAPIISMFEAAGIIAITSTIANNP